MESAAPRDPLTGLLLAGAAVALPLGLVLPAITVEQFLVFGDTTSIGGAIVALLEGGHPLLGLVVALFSVVFPVAKLLLTVRVWLARDLGTPGVRRAIRWTAALGKWSMLDVFMAAIVVATLTLGTFASVTTDVGLYIFGGAIVLAMLAANRMEARIVAAP